MVLQNLVFNRLGNSFSALLHYENKVVQLWDNVKNSYFEITHVCTSDEKPFSVSLYIGEKNVDISFHKDGFLLENFDFLISQEGFILKISLPELIFKLSMIKPAYMQLKVKEDYIEIIIPEKDFFKAISEFYTSIIR